MDRFLVAISVILALTLFVCADFLANTKDVGGFFGAASRAMSEHTSGNDPNFALRESLMSKEPRFYIYDNPEIVTDFRDEETEDGTLLLHLSQLPGRVEKPEMAEVFVIPTPLYKLLELPNEQREQIIDKAFTSLTQSPWFQRNQGRDHLIGCFDWRCSGWARHGNPIFPKRWHEALSEVALTRFEVWNKKAWEFTKRNIVVPYRSRVEVVNPTYEDWSRRRFTVWYHARTGKYSGDGHFIRYRPFSDQTIWPNCSIGFELPFDEWQKGWQDSKFCLILKGDTPTSHSFSNAIASSCVPVIISDDFDRVGLPFRAVVDLDSFSIRVPEREWLDGGLGPLLSKLEHMDKVTLEAKLDGLRKVKPILLWEDPKSMVAPLILEELTRSALANNGTLK